MLLPLVHHNQKRTETRLDLLNAELETPWPLSATCIPTSLEEVTACPPSMRFRPNGNGPTAGGQPPRPSYLVSPTVAAGSLAPGSPSPCCDAYLARAEILSHLPFLSNYNLQSPEMPFVVDHFKYGTDTHPSPVGLRPFHSLTAVCAVRAVNRCLHCRSWSPYPGRNSRHPSSYLPTRPFALS